MPGKDKQSPPLTADRFKLGWDEALQHIQDRLTVCHHGWECPYGCCWPVQGSINNSGYTNFYINKKLRPYFNYHDTTAGHRVMFVAFKGDIPEGMTVDHACHKQNECWGRGRDCPHRKCGRPHHLTLLRESDNKGQTGRKQEIGKPCLDCGTPLTGSNYRTKANGQIECRICKRLAREERKRMKEAS